MTTIKEYKALLDGATDAPWSVYNPDNKELIDDIYHNKDGIINPSEWSSIKINDAKFIAASRNIAPDLIRVIELAERGLINAKSTLKHHHISELIYIQEALSEIRKLKGD